MGIYVYAPERIKIQRFLNRESRNDDKFFEEFYRRMLDDLTAFENVKQDENVFKVENIDLEKAIEKIKIHLQEKGVLHG
jgi:cytidylate kinase